MRVRASDSGGLRVNPSSSSRRISTSSLGAKTIRARAVDRCGNTTTRSFRYTVVASPTLRIIGTPPTCALGGLRIRVSVTSPVSLRSAVLRLDGRVVRTTRSKSFSVLVPGGSLAAGSRQLRLNVVDAVGNRRSAARRFSVCRVFVPLFTG